MAGSAFPVVHPPAVCLWLIFIAQDTTTRIANNVSLLINIFLLQQIKFNNFYIFYLYSYNQYALFGYVNIQICHNWKKIKYQQVSLKNWLQNTIDRNVSVYKQILIIMQSEGRRYVVAETVTVRDWDTFKKAWRDNKCIKQWGDPTTAECKQLIKQSLIQLIKDESHQCYVFPDSLKPEYIAIIIEFLTTQEFKIALDYQHEGMYLDKPKQLIVFKRRSSTSSYLSKYRLNNDYKKLFEAVHQVCKTYQLLIAQRNLKISQELPQQEIDALTKKIKDFQDNQLQPKLVPWRKLVMRSIQDFKNQPKKQQIMFIGINSLLVKQIKQICNDFELYYGNRYEKVSIHDEYRDFCVCKYDRSEPSYSFDDRSSSSNVEPAEVPEQKEQDWNNQVIIAIPRSVQTVTFNHFCENGIKCSVFIPSFGKTTPIQYIKIRLAYPRITEQQIKYEQTIPVTQSQYQYECTLHCMQSGRHCFQFKTGNSAGECKDTQKLQVWMDGDSSTITKQGIMKLKQTTNNLYVMGQNEEGLIPNWNTQSKDIIRTTSQTWQQFKFLCSDFSISSHGIICNAQGQVAGWGKMYYFDEQGLNQDQKQDEQQDETDILQLNRQVYQIQKPSLIISSERIRKVSCGEGYCLMVDSFGKAWSFGYNVFGQLGLQHTNQSIDTSDPVIIPYFKAQKIFVVDAIASFFGASFALDDQGQAYRWGSNQIEQTNRPVKDSYNNVINYEYPQIVAAQSLPTLIGKKFLSEKVISIHPGFQFTLLLTQKHKLYGWGNTKFLGLGNVEDAHFKPIQNLCNPVPVLENVSAVSVGRKHIVALKIDKKLVGWGQTKCFSKQKNLKDYINKPQSISENYEGYFQCGPQFTIFQQKQNNIRVVGNEQIFKEGTYKLPGRPIKIKAGEGVIIVMTSVKQSKAETKEAVQPIETTYKEEIKQEKITPQYNQVKQDEKGEQIKQKEEEYKLQQRKQG